MKSKGFTLIELIIYMAIAGMVIFTISVFLSALLVFQVKNQTIAEVEQQGRHAMTLITQSIRNADSINYPVIGNDATSTLSLQTYVPASNPTVFDLSSGVLRMIENGTTYPITNNKIVVSNLSFQNLAWSGTPGSIRITFTISFNSASNQNQYQYQQTFINTASLRQP